MIPTSDDILTHIAQACVEVEQQVRAATSFKQAIDTLGGEYNAYIDLLQKFAGAGDWDSRVAVANRVYMNHDFGPGIQTLDQGKWHAGEKPDSIKMDVCFADDDPTRSAWARDFIVEFFPETSAVLNISLGPITKEYPLHEAVELVTDAAEKLGWAWMGTTNA